MLIFFEFFFRAALVCLFSLEKLNEMKLSRHHILFRCFTFFKQPQITREKKIIKKATHNTDKTKRTTTTRRFLPNPHNSPTEKKKKKN